MMRGFWIGLVALAAMLTAPPVAAQASLPGADAAPYLAGNWKMLFEGKGDCGFPASGNQIGFEFARSGGRALFYEGPDLWTAYVGIETRLDGNTIAVTAVDLEGKRRPLWSLKRLGPDEMQFSGTPDSPGRMLVRCPASDPLPIAADVTQADLFALTPNMSGLPNLFQIFPGEDPAKLCTASERDPVERTRISIGFEIFGPGHAWIFVFGQSPLADFSTIHAIRRTAPDTLALAITYLPTRKDIDLEVRILPDRIEIPAMGAQFFTCKPEQIAAIYKHRSEEH